MMIKIKKNGELFFVCFSSAELDRAKKEKKKDEEPLILTQSGDSCVVGFTKHVDVVEWIRVQNEVQEAYRKAHEPGWGGKLWSEEDEFPLAMKNALASFSGKERDRLIFLLSK
ncbi:MAG: hypothetical protein G01um101418_9 [Parcubacteria group bacterium Gr01-1014_18]|nr:MAG: hypothetical protein Greene041636_9 [Parcubacteria group bacterium Greene0416_36]TSC81515.1 MAG: hypothetical protein G01um101418_9 [Parcubacteria group bacterium Gr01-1014_18]TSC99674.1 MAG: hypothetical protein Greene101420_78 [Parcubacteria group bacterium Greene1014_20]TSD07125.1 MAG: hypothetical protein Greene07142_437 [Parcubacteria group bacterium Greene0714_2]